MTKKNTVATLSNLFFTTIFLFFGGLVYNETIPNAFPNKVGPALIFIGLFCFFFGIPGSFLVLCDWFEEPRYSTFKDNQIPLVYSEKYNIEAYGLEKMHPFDSCKYRHIYDKLVEYDLIQHEAIEPFKPTAKQLLSIHSSWYLLFLNSTIYLSSILEVPIVACLPTFLVHNKVLEPMLYQTGGTILACREAKRNGWCINLGGGFHHASGRGGGGFCVYADITLAISELRKTSRKNKNLRVMIVDLDAHQGNGHERDFKNDKNTYIFDMYNPYIYPNDKEAKAGISKSVLVYGSKSEDENYLTELNTELSEALEEFQPQFILYNAGSDCLDGDPLGGLYLSPKGLIRRDEIVFEKAIKLNIPIAMVLSGGYQMTNAQYIAKSLKNLHKQFKIFDKMSTEVDLDTLDDEL